MAIQLIQGDQPTWNSHMPYSTIIELSLEQIFNSKTSFLRSTYPNVFSVFKEAELGRPASSKVLTESVVIYHFIRAGRLLALDVYRAPEVTVKMHWDNEVNIWIIAMMLLDGTLHPAEMVAIVEPCFRKIPETK
ncbi:hypothetical protein AJ78_03112 [Emergomyces pasteurianus Ep9510]|uniref:Uncharacterized protein n=1 Tax=Emergomyces pasteurianus Ep9510 TaxID=1447872 RepID=A0A1J9QNA9_9EURO|nr:hypothetical protein AJ78_03112 [Emergomyces pasteurianus Ep9510]